MSNTLATANMVTTGTGKGGDLLVKGMVKTKIKPRSVTEVVGKIGCAPARQRKKWDSYFAYLLRKKESCFGRLGVT